MTADRQDFYCPFCGAPADGYDANHLALALMGEVSDRVDSTMVALYALDDFVAEHADQLDEETKAVLLEHAAAIENVITEGTTGAVPTEE